MKNFLSWAEIDKVALLSNVASFRKLIGPKVKLLTVVKGNAYGHGIKEVASIIKNEVDWFGVNNLDESLILKKIGVKKPILILGYTQNNRLSEVVQNGFHQVIYNKESALQLNKLKKPCQVHLKIETGTNRQGVKDRELLELIRILKKRRINIEGVSMHFATLEEEENKNAFYKKQINKFRDQLKLLEENGINPQIIHTAATAAVILYPETYFDMVRVGIGLYGLWPSELVKTLAKKKEIKFDLKPVLSWKTRVAQIKDVKKGETIGYGRTYKVRKETKIAILPVGYFDGYDRHLSNIGRVIIRGQFANVVGRVMMNMIVIDVSDIKNIKVEDEVVLIGKQALSHEAVKRSGSENKITAEELAEKIGTINYEVVTRINPLLPRLIV